MAVLSCLLLAIVNLSSGISRADDGGSPLDSYDAGVDLVQLKVEPQPDEAASVPSPAFTNFFQRLPLSFGVFGDVKAGVSNGEIPAFGLGELDFFVTSKPHQNLDVLAELVFAVNFNQTYRADVERLMATWTFDPLLRITAGRLHQALGHYNNRFHHGAFIANGIERPAVVAFEDDGGPLPVHGVGLEASGVAELGEFSLGYSLAISNGRGASPAQILSTRDFNPAKSVLGSLTLSRIDWGLRIGVNALYDKIPAEDFADAVSKPAQDEVIVGAHVLLERARLWFLAEGYLVNHTSAALGERQLLGFFAEARVNVRPVYFYGRFDILKRPSEIDPFYSVDEPLASQRSVLLGVGWKIATGVVLKAEGQLSFAAEAQLTGSARAQLAWAW
jgi:hypothetical protein